MTRCTTLIGAAAAILLTVHAARAQETTQEAATSDTAVPRASVADFTLDDHPTVTFGSLVTIELKTRMEATMATSAHESPDGDWTRRRVGFAGTFANRVEVDVEGELADDEGPWRDVFVDARVSRWLRVRAGQFKVPFGRDELTSGADLSFVGRSQLSNALAPGRDIGVMVHGRARARRVTYAAGFFARDGRNARRGDARGADDTWASRVTVRPFPSRKGAAPLERLEVGVAATSSRLAEGLNGLRGETAGIETTFFEPVFVRGRRLRVGLDAAWQVGALLLTSELARVADERRGQGLRNGDLPALIAHAWYVAGAWSIGATRDDDALVPRRAVFRGGAGALELGARIEREVFTAGSPDATAVIHPRAADIPATSNRVVTLAANWYLNRFVRLKANAIHESVSRAFVAAPLQRGWQGLFQLQFVL